MRNDKKLSGGGDLCDSCSCGGGGNISSSGLNGAIGGINNCGSHINAGNDWRPWRKLPRDRVQEEDSGDDYSYSNLGYDNAIGSIGSFPIDYQSNESLFNMNFDAVEDNIFEINKLALFEPSDLATTADITSTGAVAESAAAAASISSTCTGTAGAAATSTTTATSGLSVPISSPRFMVHDKRDIDTFTVPDLSRFSIVHAKPLLVNAAASGGGGAKTIMPIELTKEQSVSQPLPDSPPKKPEKLRCAACNKKLGVIMIMRCHCEKVFCAQHRYAEAHNCSYNFKLEGKHILARENPLVIAQKLPKI